MGRLLQVPLFAAFTVGCLLAGPVSPATEPPQSLPEPPPLPQEMLDKRPKGPPPDLPDPSELVDQLRQLEDLLSLPPEKLQRLRQTVEFIEKMSPQEREAMRIRLAQVTRMNDHLQREIDTFSALLKDIPKSDFSQFWLASSDEERAAIRESLKKSSEKEGLDFLRTRVEAFVEKRDQAFARMRESLEAKRRALQESP